MEEYLKISDDIKYQNGKFYYNKKEYHWGSGYKDQDRWLLITPFTKIEYGYYEEEWTETLCIDENTGEKFWIERLGNIK